MFQRLVVLGLCCFILASCEMLQRQIPVLDYCDSELTYQLWKRDNGYWLNLDVGLVDSRACSPSLNVRYNTDREINLSQNVSSPEEADSLVNKYRQLYAEKIAARKELAESLSNQSPKP